MDRTPLGRLYKLAERQGYTVHGDGMNIWLSPKKPGQAEDYSFPVTDENIDQAIAWLETADAQQREHTADGQKTQEPQPG